jgi:hypothetical protein
MPMKNSNDTIGNRTRDLPVCSAVPQNGGTLNEGKIKIGNNAVFSKITLSNHEKKFIF